MLTREANARFLLGRAPKARSPKGRTPKTDLPVSDCDDKARYIGEFEITDGHRAGKTVVNLGGKLNKCGVVSPRSDAQL